jgi:hypothetical protein
MMSTTWLQHTIPDAFAVNGFPLVEFDRPLEPSVAKGFVLGWSRDVTIIHFMEEERFRLNGYRVFRNRDVKRWRPVTPDDSWLVRRG